MKNKFVIILTVHPANTSNTEPEDWCWKLGRGWEKLSLIIKKA